MRDEDVRTASNFYGYRFSGKLILSSPSAAGAPRRSAMVTDGIEASVDVIAIDQLSRS